MANNNIELDQLDPEDLDMDDEISDEDYGIILGPDGELKSIFLPMEYFEIPEKVRVLFALLGVDDPESVVSRTVH